MRLLAARRCVHRRNLTYLGSFDRWGPVRIHSFNLPRLALDNKERSRLATQQVKGPMSCPNVFKFRAPCFYFQGALSFRNLFRQATYFASPKS